MPVVSAAHPRNRRRFIAGAAGLLLLPVRLARADDRAVPITFIIPAPAGVSSDRLGRVIAETLSSVLGTEVLVDNLGGDSGVTGTNALATAAPDGTVIGLAISSAIISGRLLSRNARFNPVEAFQWLAIFGTFPTAMVIAANSPHKTVLDWVAAARASPAPLVYASAGTGSAGHFAGAYLRAEQGARLTHRSLDSLDEGYALLATGAIDALFDGVPNAMIEVPRSGHRIVAVTSAARLPALPAIPSFGEMWQQSFVVWIGLVAPRRIDSSAYSRLSGAVGVLLNDTRLVARLQAEGLTVTGMNGRAAVAFLESEIVRYARLIAALSQERQRN